MSTKAWLVALSISALLVSACTAATPAAPAATSGSTSSGASSSSDTSSSTSGTSDTSSSTSGTSDTSSSTSGTSSPSATPVPAASSSSSTTSTTGSGETKKETGEAAKAEQVMKDTAGSSDVVCEEGKESWRSPGPPVRGGSLVWATSPVSHLESGGAFQVYNSLLQERKCFVTDRVIVPSLAKSWEVSPNGLTWTLKLNDNVKWQNMPPVNGRAFDSSDVAWMIDYQKEKGRERVWWEHVNYTTPDKYTIVLNLTRPDPDFVYKLGAGANLMKAKEVFEQDDGFRKTAVGTGAYMAHDWKTGQGVTGVKNPDYWETGADGKPLPYLDEIKKVAFGDIAAELAAMRAGQTHHPGTFGFRPDMLKILRDSDLKLTFYDILPPIHGAVWFDTTSAPWNDKRVRQATLKSIDRESLIISLQGGVVHSGYVPGPFTDAAWSEAKTIEKFAQDIPAAKKLLAEAGYDGSGPPAKMTTTGQYAQEAEVVQNLMKKAGFNVELEVAPDRSWTTTMRKLKFEIGWGVAGGSITEFPVYYLCQLVTDNPLNTTRYGDATIDKLCGTQAVELDPAKRKAIWDQLQDHLYDVVPYVPTVGTIYGMALACEVKNYKRVHTGRNPSGFVRAWLDKSGC